MTNTKPLMVRQNALLRILCSFLIVAGFPVSGSPVVHTDDGLSIALGKNGQVTEIHLHGHDVALSENRALFEVRDAAAKSDFFAVPASLRSSNNELRIRSVEHPLDLDVSATISSRGGFLQIDGDVACRDDQDRCVDLKLRLPVATADFLSGHGLLDGWQPAHKARAKEERTDEREVDGSVSKHNSVYPLCPLSNAAMGVGLSLAVPPTHPTRFVTGSDTSGAYIVFRIGLSKDTAVSGKTAFRAIFYRHDPMWGFRSSLERYYSFYRDDFFKRRIRRFGAWTTQNASQLKNPRLYAYHEAGFATWHHPNGTKTGVNVGLTLEHLDEGPICGSLEQYEELCELALDEKYGIYSLPYTIVGQRQILQLPALPRNYEEATNALATWQTAKPILFDGPPQAVSFRSAEELRSIIRNSSIYDIHDRLRWIARPYRGPTLTFPQNPDPRLYGDNDKATIAKYTLDYYVPMMLKSRFVGGCYLDSLGRWCGLYNYRREHFKYATVPLTYAGDPPRPCIWNFSSHAAYLWELGRRLHAQDKIFIANGIHADRVMLGFACDVMGEEGTPTYEAGENFCALRVAAASKPYCVLNASHKLSPRLWNSCLFMGFIMGANSEKGWADEAKYLPLVIKINEAGWEPVTYAYATPAAVGVERWGGRSPKDPLFFTLMNRSRRPVDAELSIDLAALRRTGDSQHVTALPREMPIEPHIIGERLVLKVKLEPEEASAIRMTR